MSAVSSPHTKAPEPLGDADVEAEVGAQDVLTQQAVVAAGLDGDAQALQGQRILGPAVDVALVGADGARPDHHALEDGVRVALQDAPVHERARVALVGVAEDVLLVARGLGGELPLEAGGETGAPAAAQTALLDLVDDPLGGHLGEGLGEAGVAVAGYVLVDALRRDAALVAQYAQVLPGEEGDVLEQRDAGLRGGMLVHQPLHRATFDHVLGHDLGRILGLDLVVEDPAGVDDEQGAAGAEAVAARLDDPDLVGHALYFQLLYQGRLHPLGARRQTGGAEAHHHVHAGCLVLSGAVHISSPHASWGEISSRRRSRQRIPGPACRRLCARGRSAALSPRSGPRR